jgi:hypothetical protein
MTAFGLTLLLLGTLTASAPLAGAGLTLFAIGIATTEKDEEPGA